jgi:hypothetical protein
MPRFAPLFLALLLCGCGNDPFRPRPIPPPPPGDENVMQRFERVYEFQDLPNYEKLLTSDFRYTFSAASDPNLVAQYGNNWGKDDEVESTKHLFEGFTNSAGDFFPAASRIDMTLTGVQYQPDFTHADSAAYYQKVVVTAVDMTIEVPTTPDPTTYQISARHEFYIVRGDAAVLDANQEARADRWYIRRWDDLSTGTAVKAPIPSTRAALFVPATWGALRAALS